MSDKKTWRALVKELDTATEERCKEMLKEERDGMDRPLFKNKIFGRYNRLRQIREREELTADKD